MLKYLPILLFLLTFSSNSNAQDSTSYNLSGLVTKTTADNFGFQFCQAIKDSNKIDSLIKSPKDLIPLIHDTVLTHLELKDPNKWDFTPTLYRSTFKHFNNEMNDYSDVKMVAAKMQYEGEQYYTNYGFGILFGDITIRFTSDEYPSDIEEEKIRFVAFEIGGRFYLIDLD